MVDSKISSAADKIRDSGMVFHKLTASHQERARKLAEHTESSLSHLIVGAYRFFLFRRLCLVLVRHVEGGAMHSPTLRRLLRHYHRVEVGRYSYGDCLVPGLLPPGTSVGNYCSVADGLRVFRRNHPVCHLSQHPFFFNAELGFLDEDTIEPIQNNPLTIGHDVWIGADVTILPGCKNIGNGAIIGACSVVTKDISPFTINVGNPARQIGYRFNSDIRAQIERTQWWSLSLTELVVADNLLYAPVTKDGLEVFLSLLESEDAKGY